MSYFDTEYGFVISLDEQLGSGGRGKVMPIEYLYDLDLDIPAEELVCKVIDERFRSAGRKEKVRVLREMGAGCAAHISATWPVADLTSEGEWVGYLMPRVSGRSLSEVRADEQVPFTKKVALMRRMCLMLDELHKLGIVMGDVSMANFLYDDAADELFLIDVDSMQVVDEATRAVYPTVESREKSPEMLAGMLGELLLTSRSDDFLAGVEVFRMLFDAHPFDEYRKDVSPMKVRAENIRARRFAYAVTDEACGVGIFGERLGELFHRTFAGEYEQIPSVRAYVEALAALECESFEPCEACGGVHVKPSFTPADMDVVWNGETPRDLANRAFDRAGAWLEHVDGATLKRAAVIAAAACGVCLVAPGAADAAGVLVVEGQEWLTGALGWLDGAGAQVDAALASAGEAFGDVAAWAGDAAAWAGEALAGAPEAIGDAIDQAEVMLEEVGAALESVAAELKPLIDELFAQVSNLFE